MIIKSANSFKIRQYPSLQQLYASTALHLLVKQTWQSSDLEEKLDKATNTAKRWQECGSVVHTSRVLVFLWQKQTWQSSDLEEKLDKATNTAKRWQECGSVVHTSRVLVFLWQKQTWQRSDLEEKLDKATNTAKRWQECGSVVHTSRVLVFLWQKLTSVLQRVIESPSDAIKPDQHAEAFTGFHEEMLTKITFKYIPASFQGYISHFNLLEAK